MAGTVVPTNDRWAGARARVDLGSDLTEDPSMADFHEGQRVWIEQSDGSQRPGIFVGDAENVSWFGGTPGAYVVYPDTRSGDEVSYMRITPREEDVEADATRPG
jgi:hypothetical protein